ncbi:MAG: endonuclease/exonuclease/phosphatase family protein [Candidatus Pacearchaeota archaeon]
MKLITLNTWGGRAGKERILDFFKKNKKIDIFCLQEVWSAPHTHLDGHDAGGVPIDHNNIMTHGMQDISETLSEHVGYFRPHFGDNYGLMMFVRKGLEVVAEGEIFVYKEKGYVPDGDIGNHARNIQYVTLLIDDKPVTIINFHGLWNGKGKTDTEDRLNQSKNIIKFINSLNGECILCGDFNLLPTTKSIELFEGSGLINLIREYDIKSTRTSHYEKPEKHADYIFISKNVKVKKFEVLPDEVSDHAPILLEFDLE